MEEIDLCWMKERINVPAVEHCVGADGTEVIGESSSPDCLTEVGERLETS